jgi:hypothetical protein
VFQSRRSHPFPFTFPLSYISGLVSPSRTILTDTKLPPRGGCMHFLHPVLALILCTYSPFLITGTSEIAITRSSVHAFKICSSAREEGTIDFNPGGFSLPLFFHFSLACLFCSRLSHQWNRCPHDLGRSRVSFISVDFSYTRNLTSKFAYLRVSYHLCGLPTTVSGEMQSCICLSPCRLEVFLSSPKSQSVQLPCEEKEGFM